MAWRGTLATGVAECGLHITHVDPLTQPWNPFFNIRVGVLIGSSSDNELLAYVQSRWAGKVDLLTYV